MQMGYGDLLKPKYMKMRNGGKMKKKIKEESKSIDTLELLNAMDELEKENGINKDSLMESIEQALLVAYKRNFNCSDDNIKVEISKIDGQMHVYQMKTVVLEVSDDKKEISLDDALKINPDYKEGDVVQFEIMPKQFGRIAAQTARQIITQKIREESRNVLFNEFKEKEGEIVTGLIQKVDRGAVIMDLGKIEGIMPKREQIPTEKYHVNDKIKACIISVAEGKKGSMQITLSRSSTKFVKRLFEIEIPEIDEGLIEIKSISRDAGSRSKVAICSPNPNIDPVGSCVGQKGIRIQNIINELNGEKIDVIEWSEDPSTFISSALLPATVLAVDVKEEEHFAQVIVPDDQLSLAIGKGGQNAKLAAKLTNWKIDIKSETQFRKMLENAQKEASDKENTEENKEDTNKGYEESSNKNENELNTENVEKTEENNESKE